MKQSIRRRWVLAGLLLALLAVQLTGCGGSSKESKDSVVSQNAPSVTGFYGGGSDTAAADEAEYGWIEVAPGSEDVRLDQTKIIRTASLRMETREFEGAVKALDQAVEAAGGWYESRQLEEGGRYRSFFGSIRVPVERFDELLGWMGETAHVTSRCENKDDVSEDYYDSETRLTTQRTKLERLQTLLERAESMEDIIALESAISETELQIEYLTGSLRHYDSQINYSTVTVDLQEVYRLSDDETPPLTFGQRVVNALTTGWQRGVESLEDTVIFLVENWFSLLLLAAAVLAAVLFFRHHRKKWRERQRASAERAAAEQKSREESGDAGK